MSKITKQNSEHKKQYLKISVDSLSKYSSQTNLYVKLKYLVNLLKQTFLIFCHKNSISKIK